MGPHDPIWSLPPCIQLTIASYVPSPIDLYVYICRAYFIHCKSHADPGGLGGTEMALRSRPLWGAGANDSRSVSNRAYGHLWGAGANDSRHATDIEGALQFIQNIQFLVGCLAGRYLAEKPRIGHRTYRYTGNESIARIFKSAYFWNTKNIAYCPSKQCK